MESQSTRQVKFNGQQRVASCEVKSNQPSVMSTVLWYRNIIYSSVNNQNAETEISTITISFFFTSSVTEKGSVSMTVFYLSLLLLRKKYQLRAQEIQRFKSIPVVNSSTEE